MFANFGCYMPVANFFVERQLARFRSWWRAPATAADRAWAFVLGAWAGLWLGALGRLALGRFPVPIGDLFWFAVASAIGLSVAGLFFPKTIRCIAFPFSFFGVVGVGGS